MQNALLGRSSITPVKAVQLVLCMIKAAKVGLLAFKASKYQICIISILFVITCQFIIYKFWPQHTVPLATSRYVLSYKSFSLYSYNQYCYCFAQILVLAFLAASHPVVWPFDRKSLHITLPCFGWAFWLSWQRPRWCNYQTINYVQVCSCSLMLSSVCWNASQWTPSRIVWQSPTCLTILSTWYSLFVLYLVVATYAVKDFSISFRPLFSIVRHVRLAEA